MQQPETVEVRTGESPSGSVIWLHGLGADGHDFEPIVPELRLPADLALRFVFPHAPVRPVTINGGMAMRAWYDIYDFNPGGPVDDASMAESAAHVGTLVARENQRGVPSERIVLAGFSQGGAIALQFALGSNERFAGVVGLSTYLPLMRTFGDDVGTANKDTPFFLAHGTMDPVLPIMLGQAAHDWLKKRGHTIEWHDYSMGHQVCMEEITHLAAWFRRTLAL